MHGDMISQIDASAIAEYTIIAPIALAPPKIRDTRLKLNIPYKPQFTAPKITST